jgi:hypothetical protein
LNLLPAVLQTPASTAEQAAKEASNEVEAEAALSKMGGSLIDPHHIMLKDKLAFVLGALRCRACT